MDFLDPSKKKANTRRLLFGYLLVAVALVFGSLIMLFRTYGYDLDRRTGKVIQNGLIYVSAEPDSARIFLNNKDRGETNTKFTVPSGRYSMELRRDGYTTWKKTFVLDGGSVEQLVYPLLFPAKLKTTDLKLYASTPSFASASPNRQRLLIAQPKSIVKFDLFELNKPSAEPATLNLPKDLFNQSTGNHSLSVVEWSSNNKHLLVKHKFKGGFEFVVIDIKTPSKSFNISETISASPTTVALRDGQFDSFFIYSSDDKQLQTAELNKPKPVDYINSVIDFKTFGKDKVVYATSRGAPKNNVIVKIKDGNTTYDLRKLPKADSYLLDIAEFNNRVLVIAGTPIESQVLRILKPQAASFSKNNRFIAVQHEDNFAVYDAETDRRFYYSIGSIPDNNDKANWMDGHRLTTLIKGKLMIFDFDGLNKRRLVPAQPGLGFFFDANYEQLFTIASSTAGSNKPALTLTSLIVK